MVAQELRLPLTPAALLTCCARKPHVFALDGGGPASWNSGNALIGFQPRATLEVRANGTARVCREGAVEDTRGDAFALLDRFCAEWQPTAAPASGPPAGGVLVALSYELRHWVERLGGSRPPDAALPVLHAAFYDWILSYSYARQQYVLASRGRSPAALRAVASELTRLAAAVPDAPITASARVLPDCPSEVHEAAVRAALAYIAAGDVYQVNLAQRFSLTAAPPPAMLFAALQRHHPTPFAAYLDCGSFVLVSNSPECFLARRGARLATFPIKGTRPRGVDPAADAALATALRADPKELAEHVMIVDLERNDLGRVCRTGSVRVDEFARVHSFPSVHHLVSTVTGELRPGTTWADILRATFPGGSITGAPKIRAMEIIDELEPGPRGFYTGAIGFLGCDRDGVLNLAIRTAVATQQDFTYHAGGGIVADSIPAREQEESLLKTRPIMAALRALATPAR